MTNRADGSIFYSRKNGNIHDLVELGPNAIAEVGGNQKSFEALGLLWADSCGMTDIDYDMALAVGRRLGKSGSGKFTVRSMSNESNRGRCQCI